MGFSDEEKLQRLSEVVDMVMDIGGSDVILLEMWVSPNA
jgi:hypothetical protein